MFIYIDRLLEEFATPQLRHIDHEKHVLPKEQDTMDDFINQEFDIGQSARPKYPMFPYMTEYEYEKKADELRLSNADGFIGYNLRVNKKDGSRNYEPRAVKYRKINLPATQHDREFYEMVIYSVRDDKVIAYYLCTRPRIEKEKRTAVFDFDGNPIGDKQLRKELFADKQSWQEVSNYLQKLYHEKSDDEIKIEESYSQVTTLRDRMSSIVGFIKTDPTTGNQKITDRFGSVKGWYKAKTDLTFDRFSRIIGRGNLLSTLLNSK